MDTGRSGISEAMRMSIARRIRTWAATLVAITGAATMPAYADTIYVDTDAGTTLGPARAVSA